MASARAIARAFRTQENHHANTSTSPANFPSATPCCAASRQVWLAGLGAAVVTRDWAERSAAPVFRTLVKEGTARRIARDPRRRRPRRRLGHARQRGLAGRAARCSRSARGSTAPPWRWCTSAAAARCRDADAAALPQGSAPQGRAASARKTRARRRKRAQAAHAKPAPSARTQVARRACARSDAYDRCPAAARAAGRRVADASDDGSSCRVHARIRATDARWRTAVRAAARRRSRSGRHRPRARRRRPARRHLRSRRAAGARRFDRRPRPQRARRRTSACRPAASSPRRSPTASRRRRCIGSSSTTAPTPR